MASHQPPASNPLPRAAARLLERARTEIARRQFDAARDSLAHALALAPDCVEVLALAGIVAQARNSHARAVELLRRAQSFEPADPRIEMALGISLFEQGDADAAVTALQRATELAPNVAAAWYNLGKALKLRVQMDAAIEALQRALAIDPAHVPARLTLADAQASLGDLDAAVAHLRDVLKRDPQQARAWFALANLKVEPLSREDATRLQRAFENQGAPTESRVLLGFALAKALEDQDDYESAFDVLQQANSLQRDRVKWDAASHRRHIHAIMDAFAESLPAPLHPERGGEVILICGVPRSGTTLVEQILASHPEVEGANEILDLPKVIEAESRKRGEQFPQWVHAATAEDWARLGNDYLERTAKWRRLKPRFTDKNLVNWELVGAALAMLPAARVVICRRDPLETCVACYHQWFATGAEFSYDLDEMADYCIDYEELSRFWQEKYPQRVFGLTYEALTAQPEEVIRELLAFCGLDFDAACLEPHRASRAVLSAASAGQVRRPIGRAEPRGGRYGARLDALKERLRAAGVLRVPSEMAVFL
ncbi:MAG TPA: sulfotransferase [Rhodanobacteraceae bacterium]|nr:sulfotransferase [Rhodanobacteraceae bacterium]